MDGIELLMGKKIIGKFEIMKLHHIFYRFEKKDLQDSNVERNKNSLFFFGVFVTT
jgi:hypothetical protein